MKFYREILVSSFYLIFTIALSSPSDESWERRSNDSPETYLITVDNETEKQNQNGNVFSYYLEQEEPLVDSIEYDDNYVVPPESGSNEPEFRALWHPRELPKKREFLQCKNEEPIVYLCHKSCHNVFKSICHGHTCPPRLLIQTNKQCFDNCKKSYKTLRGVEYVRPEKFK